MKLVHPRRFACRLCVGRPLDEPCTRTPDGCHECVECLRAGKPCFVHFYGLGRDARADLQGRKGRPTRDKWCHRCIGAGPTEVCPGHCDTCAECKGTAVERVHCRRHCGPCTEKLYCPIHYVRDPFEEVRGYLRDVGLGDPAPDYRLKTEVPLVLVTGWWDEQPSCKPHLVRMFLERGRPSPVQVLTDSALLDAKNPKRFDALAFGDAVTNPGALVLRVGTWGGGINKHESLPGVIVEAVRARTSKLTLLVNEPVTPWNRHHCGHSDALDDLLARRGARFVLTKIEKEKKS